MERDDGVVQGSRGEVNARMEMRISGESGVVGGGSSEKSVWRA